MLPCNYCPLLVAMYSFTFVASTASSVLSIAMGLPHPALVPLAAQRLNEIVIPYLPLSFIMLFTIIVFAARPILREFHEFSLQMKQLQTFSVEEAACTCCSANHVDPDSGEVMPCDRELIEESGEGKGGWHKGGWQIYVILHVGCPVRVWYLRRHMILRTPFTPTAFPLSRRR